MGEPRTLLTPAEANRALEETTQAWNALRNSAFGRSGFPPALPPEQEKIREQIEVSNQQFRTWRSSLGAWDSFNMSWGSELAEWRARYDALSREWSQATGRVVIQLAKVQGLGEATATALGRVGVSAGWLVAGGLGLMIWLKSREKGKR